jgi:hypothetical protein
MSNAIWELRKDLEALKTVVEHRAAGSEDLLPNLVSGSEYGYAFIETLDLTNIHRALGGREIKPFLRRFVTP